jgi:hypothetical protein
MPKKTKVVQQNIDGLDVVEMRGSVVQAALSFAIRQGRSKQSGNAGGVLSRWLLDESSTMSAEVSLLARGTA